MPAAKSRNAFYAQSGGVTAVINASACGVIETCRKRAVSPWPYLAEVVRQRRKGLPAPPLPSPAI